MKSPEDILKEALGEIRYKLNGTVTNAQLKWALEEYARLYHESKVEKIFSNVPVSDSLLKDWDSTGDSKTGLQKRNCSLENGTRPWNYPSAVGNGKS